MSHTMPAYQTSPQPKFPHFTSYPHLIKYKIATAQNELEQAYRLLHDVYVKSGYMDPSPSGMRISVYNAIPEVKTFVAKIDNKVISCLTLIPDSPLGLPMDEIYYPELNRLRLSGRKIAEISGFASDEEYVHKGPVILLKLLVLLYMEGLKNSLDDICIAVNPRHKTFYEKGLLFSLLGDLKTYNGVNGAPAFALRLEVASFFRYVSARINRLYRLLAQELKGCFSDVPSVHPSVMSVAV